MAQPAIMILLDRRENRAYLPGINLPANVAVTQSLEAAGSDKRLVICAVPSHAVRDVFTKLAPASRSRPCWFAVQKVLKKRPSTPWASCSADIFGAASKRTPGFLSGPTFAIEVARELPAAVTVARIDRNRCPASSSDSQHAEFAGLYFGRRRRRANWRGGQKVIAIAAGSAMAWA